MEFETGGYISYEALREIGGTRTVARALVAAGLWHVDGEGWTIHDWEDEQREALAIQEKRRKDRERAREKYRADKAGEPTFAAVGVASETPENPLDSRARIQRDESENLARESTDVSRESRAASRARTRPPAEKEEEEVNPPYPPYGFPARDRDGPRRAGDVDGLAQYASAAHGGRGFT